MNNILISLYSFFPVSIWEQTRRKYSKSPLWAHIGCSLLWLLVQWCSLQGPYITEPLAKQKSSSFVILQIIFMKVLCWVSTTFFRIGTYPVSIIRHKAKDAVLWHSPGRQGCPSGGCTTALEPADSAAAVSSDSTMTQQEKQKPNKLFWATITEQYNLR